jgi:hypothetical protein
MSCDENPMRSFEGPLWVMKRRTQPEQISVTQQNSALVEENAATAKTLESQSAAMGERIEFFRLYESAGVPGRSAAA